MTGKPDPREQAGDAAPSPEHFIHTLMSFQKTAALKAAVEIGLFGAVAAGSTSAGDIARATGSDERGAAILADYLVLLGFLTRQDGRYGLTRSSAVFLDPRSPAYFGGIVAFLASPEMIGLILGDPAAYVRQGGSVGLANVAPDNPVWIKFAKAMVPLMAPAAAEIAARAAAFAPRPRKVVDISAGHGRYGIAVAEAIPDAEIVAVDWGNVLALARENAVAAGVGDRYRTVAGSAFDVDWGGDCDLVLIPSFLHHFDPDACATLVAKARASLAPGGRVLAVEFVVDEDRLSPPWPAGFSHVMLATTPKGQAYTARELDEIGRKAGFAGARVEPIMPPHSLVWFE